MSQTITSTLVKDKKFSFYCGVGPNFYFNNLVLAKNYVNVFNFSISGRIMWEPENNLSLGIESGYYRLFSLDLEFGTSGGNVQIVRVAIPIHFVASMKFLKDYYCNFSSGPSILLDLVNTSDFGNFDASTLALADFALTIGHKQLIGNRIYLGTEIKGFYSTKLDDKSIALLFMAGIRF